MDASADIAGSGSSWGHQQMQATTRPLLCTGAGPGIDAACCMPLSTAGAVAIQFVTSRGQRQSRAHWNARKQAWPRRPKAHKLLLHAAAAAITANTAPHHWSSIPVYYSSTKKNDQSPLLVFFFKKNNTQTAVISQRNHFLHVLKIIQPQKMEITHPAKKKNIGFNNTGFPGPPICWKCPPRYVETAASRCKPVCATRGRGCAMPPPSRSAGQWPYHAGLQEDPAGEALHSWGEGCSRCTPCCGTSLDQWRCASQCAASPISSCWGCT